MRFITGNKAPRETGIRSFEKDGEAASGLRREKDGAPFKQNAPCQKHHPKISSLAESPTAPIRTL